MTNEAKPTPGPVRVFPNDLTGHCEIVPEGAVGPVIARINPFSARSEAQGWADAHLIAEAFNVHHETDLTPRELLEKLAESERGWSEGPPPKPWADEWFIAQTTYGDKVVLKALPEDYAYDFRTADETYIKADAIAKWMQFPNSQFVDFRERKLRQLAEQRAELLEALEAASKYVVVSDHPTSGADLKKVEAAIAKARGGAL